MDHAILAWHFPFFSHHFGVASEHRTGRLSLPPPPLNKCRHAVLPAFPATACHVVYALLFVQNQQELLLSNQRYGYRHSSTLFSNQMLSQPSSHERCLMRDRSTSVPSATLIPAVHSSGSLGGPNREVQASAVAGRELALCNAGDAKLSAGSSWVDVNEQSPLPYVICQASSFGFDEIHRMRTNIQASELLSKHQFRRRPASPRHLHSNDGLYHCAPSFLHHRPPLGDW